jgi:hypothetical protein
LKQALLCALQIATTVDRACEDVGPGRRQPWLQQIAKAETGNEPSIRKAALATESIAGCVRLHAIQPRGTMQPKRRGSIRGPNYANPTNVYSPFENTGAELQRR